MFQIVMKRQEKLMFQQMLECTGFLFLLALSLVKFEILKIQFDGKKPIDALAYFGKLFLSDHYE